MILIAVVCADLLDTLRKSCFHAQGRSLERVWNGVMLLKESNAFKRERVYVLFHLIDQLNNTRRVCVSFNETDA